MDTKICNTCGETKHLVKFKKVGRNGSYRSKKCNQCVRLAYFNDPVLGTQRRRNHARYHKKNRWMLAVDFNPLQDYEPLLKKQKGRCAICRRKPGSKKFAVDHCHKRLVVRGLLCDRCNRAIGAFEDDPKLLRRAADYLDQ